MHNQIALAHRLCPLRTRGDPHELRGAPGLDLEAGQLVGRVRPCVLQELRAHAHTERKARARLERHPELPRTMRVRFVGEVAERHEQPSATTE
jgi:hypothetical protein